MCVTVCVCLGGAYLIIYRTYMYLPGCTYISMSRESLAITQLPIKFHIYRESMSVCEAEIYDVR